MRKIGLLSLILVLTLASVGVGYAMWSATLVINGTVNTGDLEVEFSAYSAVEDPPEAGGKDVAQCTVTPEDPDGDGDIDLLTVTIVNGYPSYWCLVSYTIHNNGSIPAKLTAKNLTFDPELDVTQSCALSVGDVLDPCQTANCSLAIHVNDDAAENSTYTLTKTYTFAQWNDP